ncbi:MAG: IPT/TIG domain-containing protein [bacterium]
MNKKCSFNFRMFALIPLMMVAFCVAGNALAASVGDTVNFYTDSHYDISGRGNVDASLRVISDRIYFYIEDEYWESLKNQKSSFLTRVEDLAYEFDNVIYPIERSVFGSEWSPGIDNDEKITVLISQLVDDAGGYFRVYDNYPKNILSKSNEREMVYINTSAMFDPRVNAFLAHEFQHLITFYQKTILYNLDEDIWLNEARSEYATTLCGYNDKYAGSHLADRVDSFWDFPTDSLTEWQNNPADYSVATLFLHYLVDHYGDQIITKMMMNDKVGIESIEQALDDLNYEEDFTDIFADWTVANYLNNCDVADGQYCYKDENLTYERLHTDYSASYSGFPNLIVSRSSAAKNWSPRWYRFRQGTEMETDRDTLKLEFKGIGESAEFYVPYIIADKNNQTTVQFMSLEDENGVVYIPEFTSQNKSVVIAPFNKYKKDNFGDNESLTAFTFTASSVNESHMSIIEVTPSSGSVAGGYFVSLKGSKLADVQKVNFGQSVITDFEFIDDELIKFRAPAQDSGKITINIVDSNGDKALLINGFSYKSGDYSEGSLLRAKGDYKVYIIKDGYKRWIQHQDIFNMYGHLNWEDIIDVEPSELEQYREAWLIRADGDKKVYEVNADGTKHWLNMTAEQFSNSGHLWDMVYVTNNFERDFYKTGSHILFQ